MKQEVLKAYAVTPNQVTMLLVCTDGQIRPFNITSGHPNFERIREQVIDGDAEGLEELCNISKAVVTWGNGKVTVVDGEVLYNGTSLHNSLTHRILDAIDDGEDSTHLINFLENLQNNPSMVAREELYDFLSGNNLPFTPDGYFVAYKRVKNNFHDIYTGSMDNSPGKVVEMDRRDVDDNRENTCSKGLHFASLEYARDHYGCGSGNRMVVVKINPADVVSIPTDYNRQKGRAAKYEVIGEIALDKLYQKDYLESMSVLHSDGYDHTKETLDEFVDRKSNASQQPRDSRGRFTKKSC